MAQRDAINIVPLGFGDHPFITKLSERLRTILGQSVQVLASEEAPTYALNRGRRQYLTSDILKAILKGHESDSGKVIAIADVDLYVPGLNFVFGEAQLQGKAAVVSLARLRPSFCSQPENPSLFLSRAIKETVHELGHTYGLTHCSNSECVMSFSNSIRDVDLKGENFCPACRLRYQKFVGRIGRL